MSTDVRASHIPHPPMRPELTEHAELLRRLSRVRAALEAAARDNAQLQRQLSEARAENRRLRERLTVRPAPSVHEPRRRLLSEPWSRNP